MECGKDRSVILHIQNRALLTDFDADRSLYSKIAYQSFRKFLNGKVNFETITKHMLEYSYRQGKN